MSDLLAARAQMSTSLAFHIIFASLGIGLPLLLCIAGGLALRHQDATWMTLTRRWTKAFALGHLWHPAHTGRSDDRARTGPSALRCSLGSMRYWHSP